MKAILRRAAATATLLSVLWVSCSRRENPPGAALRTEARTVKTVRAEFRPMERVVTATGSLAAQEHATLSVKVAGRLKTMAVDLGSIVRQGDLIAQVEPRDYELRMKQAAAALAQARAAVGLPLEGEDDAVEPEKTSIVKLAKAVLDEATKNRERVVSLSKEGISPKAEFDAVEAAYIVALNRYEAALEEARTRQAGLAQRRAEFELARQLLSDTSVRAPFDGAVQMKIASVGEFLSAGAPAVTLVKTDPLRLRLEIPERKSVQVRNGQPVRMKVEGDTNAYSGRLSRVSPAINEQNRMLMAEADIPNDSSLRPGLFVLAHIITLEQDEGLAVPLASLITFAGLEKVVTVQNGKAVEKTIGTGRRGANWVEVVSGLKVGELVVVEPGNLRTGEPVSMLEPQHSQMSKTVESAGP